MPKVEGRAALEGLGAHFRTDLATHGFNGAHTWGRHAVRALFPDSQTGLSDAAVADADARTLAMHQSAAELEAFERGGELVVRAVNHTGHKLPTGFVEGRRMWIHVRFLDVTGALLAEHGAYDAVTADLTRNTKIYEAHQGLDDAVSLITGIPAGPSFHMAVNNVIEFDNRIPPRGFDNGEFEGFVAEPVGYSYPDQHYWDDSTFAIPAGAVTAEAELFFQTTSKEFIEFLRDTNTTNNAGQTAFDQWVAQGKSAPVMLDSSVLDLIVGACPAPIPYGRGKLTSNGTEPILSDLGTPSFAVNDFKLQLDGGKRNQFGILFSSDGPATTPFFGGTKYLANPIKREITFNLTANGSIVLPIPITAGMIGTAKYYQAYFRDPGSPQPVGVSAAMHVDYCP
jgi:hypothetical protein